MTYRAEPAERMEPDDLTPSMRRLLVEWQRSDLLRINAIRTLLKLPPVRVVKDEDKRGKHNDA